MKNFTSTLHLMTKFQIFAKNYRLFAFTKILLKIQIYFDPTFIFRNSLCSQMDQEVKT